MGQGIPQGSIYIINLLDEKNCRQNSRECRNTYLEGIHHIRISRYPRSIQNCTARQIVRRHNYTRIRLKLFLLAAIWSSPIFSSILLGQSERTRRTKLRNSSHENFPTTEETRPIPPPTSENQHPAHKCYVCSSYNLCNVTIA